MEATDMWTCICVFISNIDFVQQHLCHQIPSLDLVSRLLSLLVVSRLYVCLPVASDLLSIINAGNVHEYAQGTPARG